MKKISLFYLVDRPGRENALDGELQEVGAHARRRRALHQLLLDR